MDDSDSAQSLLGKKLTTVKAGWSADAADIFVLLFSFLLTMISILIIVLVFCTQANYAWTSSLPQSYLLFTLQRAVSALSATTTSAVIVVVGKRYVLFKFARGGMRSRRVAIYGRPSLRKLAHHLMRHGVELPLLALLVVWVLGYATGFTANDVSTWVPSVQIMSMTVPFGSLDTSMTPGSLLIPAIAQLNYVTVLMCAGVANAAGIVIFDGSMELTSGGPVGSLVYPPILSNMSTSASFSVPTALNGFNVSMESLSSLPPTAQPLICVDSSTGDDYTTGQLWYGGGDNQTLSIITNLPSSPSLYRFNASAIVMSGLLQSDLTSTEFVPNGKTWSNVMSSDQWAQDIVSLVCNATYPDMGYCSSGTSLLDFAMWLNAGSNNVDLSTAPGMYWSTALGLAMGAYSSAVSFGNGTTVDVPIEVDGMQFRWSYGIYVLMANVVVSIIMLVAAVKLRMASDLGGDFIDATRLLLDPLKNPELFNASFNTTVDALGNPNMLVKDNSEFLLTPLKDGHPMRPEAL